jgi:hypothetical protein
LVQMEVCSMNWWSRFMDFVSQNFGIKGIELRLKDAEGELGFPTV